MKTRFATLIALAALATTLCAQVPNEFTYQAVVRNQSGQLVANTSVGVMLQILQGAPDGTAVYTLETTVTTNNNGLFTLIVGENSDDYDRIDWSQGPYYLYSAVDPQGGTRYSLVTTQQIRSVPYAQHALVAERLLNDTSSALRTERDPYFVRWNYEYDSLRHAPTRLSQFTNDAGYLTAETQVLSLRGDTLYLSGGSHVVLHGLSDTAATHLSLSDDTLYLSDSSYVILDTYRQTLSLSGDTLYLSDGGYIVLPTHGGGLITLPALSLSGDTLWLGTDSYVILPTADSTFDYSQLTGTPSLSLSGDTLWLGTVSYVILPTTDSTFDYSQLTGTPSLSLSGDTLWLGTDSYVLLPTADSTFDYSQLTGIPSLSLSGDTLWLGTDSYVLLPTADSTFDYSQLTGTPSLSLSGDTLWLGTNSYVVLPDSLDYSHLNGAPTLSLSGDTLYLGADNYVVLPTTGDSVIQQYLNTNLSQVAFSGNYYDLSGRPSIPVIPTDVSAFNNDAGYLIRAIFDSIVQQYDHTIDSLARRILALEHPLIEGSLSGVFSVSATTRITFSQGNLQYMPSINTFNFAEHQYDIIGTANTNIADNYNGWIDLFGFGTSGWNSGVNSYQPWSTSTVASDYSVLNQGQVNDLTGIYANADWGMYNTILNGANKTGMWRTLTSAEWAYLLNSRANAQRLKGLATVNNVPGFVLLPDNWVLPEGLSFNPDAPLFTTNSYSITQWESLEAAGAVFLPATGYRMGTTVNQVGVLGYYWSSSHNDSLTGHSITIGENASVLSSNNYSNGCAVRLVRQW